MARRRRPEVRLEKEWDFLSFPVWYAFAAGLFAGIVLAVAGLSILLYPALFAFSFGNAHIVSHWFRRRVLDRRRDREEEAERERRALAARSAAALASEAGSARRRRRRRE